MFIVGSIYFLIVETLSFVSLLTQYVVQHSITILNTSKVQLATH